MPAKAYSLASFAGSIGTLLDLKECSLSFFLHLPCSQALIRPPSTHPLPCGDWLHKEIQRQPLQMQLPSQQVTKLRKNLAEEYLRYLSERDARKILTADLNELRYQREDMSLAQSPGKPEVGVSPLRSTREKSGSHPSPPLIQLS